MAETQGYGVPEHGLAPDSAGALGAHADFAGLHGGDVAVGKVEGEGVGVEVGAGVYGWAAFHDRDVYAALGEMGSEGASSGARAYDTDIEDFLWHLPS